MKVYFFASFLIVFFSGFSQLLVVASEGSVLINGEQSVFGQHCKTEDSVTLDTASYLLLVSNNNYLYEIKGPYEGALMNLDSFIVVSNVINKPLFSSTEIDYGQGVLYHVPPTFYFRAFGKMNVSIGDTVALTWIDEKPDDTGYKICITDVFGETVIEQNYQEIDTLLLSVNIADSVKMKFLVCNIFRLSDLDNPSIYSVSVYLKPESRRFGDHPISALAEAWYCEYNLIHHDDVEFYYDQLISSYPKVQDFRKLKAYYTKRKTK